MVVSSIVKISQSKNIGLDIHRTCIMVVLTPLSAVL